MRPSDSKKQKKDSEQSSQSQQQPDDDISDISDNLCTDNSPKIIPISKLPDQLRTKKIIINVSDTQYPIVEQVAEDLGWVIQNQEGSGDWDVWWTDRETNPDVLFRMHLNQRINHYPGIYVLARKNLLGMNLMSMQEKFPQDYNFFPKTWVLPLQFPKFYRYYESIPKNHAKTFIVKPQALSQGRGIFLTRNIDQLTNGQKYVVQTYIKNPYLIDGLKFDLRIYVLLAGTDPLRLYIFQEGLTRFATKPYEQPTDKNLQNSYIHLTNYSLNKNNPDYIYNQSQQQMDVGHKRTLTSTYEYLEKKGHNVVQLKEQINKIITKTVIAGLPAISHQYRYCQPQEYQGNLCFHILGVDVMITNDLKPYIIEINHTPSFQTSTPLDYKIKKNLIMDTFKLMRITSNNKKIWFEKAKQIAKKRVQTGKREIVKGEARKKLIIEAQKFRDQEQEENLGGYTKIFPFEGQKQLKKYEKMIQHSQKVHKDSHQVRKKLIRQEQDRNKQKRRQEKKNQLSYNPQPGDRRNKSNLIENRNKKIKQGDKNRKSVTPSLTKRNQIIFPDSFGDEKNQISKEYHSIGRKNCLPKGNSYEIGDFKSIIPKKTIENFANKNIKNYEIRMKTKRAPNQITGNQNIYKKDLSRFGDFMEKYISSFNTNSTEIDQAAFNILSKLAKGNKKNISKEQEKHSPIPIRKIFDQKKEDKQGTFLAPRTYQIIQTQGSHMQPKNSLHKKTIPYAQKQKNLLEMNSSFQMQRIKALETYKSISKKNRYNNS